MLLFVTGLLGVDHYGDALADADAHRCEAVPAATAPEFMNEGGENASA